MARTLRALPARPRAAREGATAGARDGHDALRGVLDQRAAPREPAPGRDVDARAAPADPPQGDGRARAPALALERALAAEPEGAQRAPGGELGECAHPDEPDFAWAGAGEAAATDVDVEQEVVIVRMVFAILCFFARASFSSLFCRLWAIGHPTVLLAFGIRIMCHPGQSMVH